MLSLNTKFAASEASSQMSAFALMNGSTHAVDSYAGTPAVTTSVPESVTAAAVPMGTPLCAGLTDTFETSNAESAPVKSVAAVPAGRSVTATVVGAVTDEPAARATGAPSAITSDGPANSIGNAGAASRSATTPSPVRRTVGRDALVASAVIAGSVCAVAWLASAIALSATNSSDAPVDVTV